MNAARDQPAVRRVSSIAVLAVLIGATGFAAGLRFENSVLVGSASPLSVALHGCALFLLAHGLSGWRRPNFRHVIGFLLACAAAAGCNELTRVRVPYTPSNGARTLATGTLTIEDAGGTHPIKLATIQVVALDAPRRFGTPLVVRELWLRSPDSNGDESSLDLELFAEFGRDREVDARAREIAAIAGHELRVLAVGRGTIARSRMRVPGATTPSAVTSGSLRIEQARPIDEPGTASWSVEGTIDLALRDGGQDRHVLGTLRGRLSWN
jgi:hypothetical protein